MKLKSSKKKIVTIVIVAIVALLIVGIVSAILIINNFIGKQISHLIISSVPTKTHYYVGDELEIDGLSIQVILNNGDSYFVDEVQCEITGFDSSKATETQKVTVTYQGYTTTFNVIIKEVPKPTPVLTGIYISQMPKTEYKVGEWLDLNGGVIMRQYQDGSTKPIDLIYQYVVSGWEIDPDNGVYASNKVGTYTLTVRYAENGIVKYTTFEIKVTK